MKKKYQTPQQAAHLDQLACIRLIMDDAISLVEKEHELVEIGQAQAENVKEAMRRLDLCKTKLEEARFWCGSVKQAIWDDPAYAPFADKRKPEEKS